MKDLQKSLYIARNILELKSRYAGRVESVKTPELKISSKVYEEKRVCVWQKPFHPWQAIQSPDPEILT